MQERKGLVTFKGNPMTLLGPEIKAGDKAPEFHAVDTALAPVALSDFRGKVKIISAVPSLDTPVCDAETRRFNEEAAKLPGNVVILTISLDLPFAQGAVVRRGRGRQGPGPFRLPGPLLRRGLRGAHQGAEAAVPVDLRRGRRRHGPVRPARERGSPTSRTTPRCWRRRRPCRCVPSPRGSPAGAWRRWRRRSISSSRTMFSLPTGKRATIIFGEMTPERSVPPKRDKSRKKDSVRFAVISPKAADPLSFSDRLFSRANLSFPRRVAAILLAAVCLCAGSALVALGVRDRSWIIGIPGALATLYGVLWARVACEGRLPGGRLRMIPWGR